ncbi:MAG TPA: DUF4251 domain-containing protein [Chitinophagaceae bacterium]|jgi:hypothetical protein
MIKSITKASLFFMIALTVYLHPVHAQDSAKDSKASKELSVKNMVDNRNYVFVAQIALPVTGGMKQLTSYYDLQVSKDTIVSALPYFGRAYTAPIDPSEGGINFTSTNFDYTTTVRKKGGWDVLIKPKDGKDVQQLFLTISENGYAVLQVASNNRQAISFNGYITERKQKRK